MELTDLTISQARAEILSGRLSCVDLAASALAAIERFDRESRAFITPRRPEDVLADARNLDSSNARDRPLLGIPIGVKDNFATAGLRTTAGSRILAKWVPRRDAHVLTRLRDAGALVVGKLNMHEFADGPTNDNPHWGRSENPRQTGRTSGGSSGGSAVALAKGMCLGATGTDTGGSIRTPAAFCGIVGLKPTFGLVGRSGIVPFSASLDHVGPMARSVRDIAILLESMAGHDPADSASVLRPAEDFEGDLDQGIRGIRVGVETSYLTAVMSPGVRTAFTNALARLTSLGAEIIEITIPAMRASLGALTAIMFAEALELHGTTLERRPMDYGRDVRLSLLSGRLYTALDYVKAQRFRSVLRAKVEELLTSTVDVLAMPTVVMEAPPWGEEMYVIDGVVTDSLNAFIRCTSPFNLTGHPALSLPCGLGELGLPVGLQLVGGYFQERALLQMGQSFEQSGPSTTDGRHYTPRESLRSSPWDEHGGHSRPGR